MTTNTDRVTTDLGNDTDRVTTDKEKLEALVDVLRAELAQFDEWRMDNLPAQNQRYSFAMERVQRAVWKATSE